MSFLLCLAVVALIAGASACLAGSRWRTRPALAPCYALLGVGLAGHLLWIAHWIGRPLGLTVSAVVVCGAAIIVVRCRVWRTWRLWSPLVGLTAGVGTATMGLAFLYGGQRDPFVTIAARFLQSPPDNVLPHLFADRIWRGEGTTALMGDWNGSDRPPLQSGFLLLVRPHEVLTGAAGTGGTFDPDVLMFALAASVVAQLMWIPAVYALLRALDFAARPTILAVVFCALSHVVFVNTMFTWPKLLSGGLAVAAVALLVDLRRHPGPPMVPVTAASVLGTLSFLAHGGAAFAAPLLVGMCLVAVRAAGRGAAVRALVAAGAAAVAVYVPWQLYGRLADPFTGRLLKWHLGGIEKPDDQGVLEAVVGSYRSSSLDQLVDDRLANLALILDVDLSGRLDLGPGWLTRVRAQDFFSTTFALGLGSVLLGAMLLVTTWRWFVRRRGQRDAGPAGTNSGLLVVWLSLASILFWALVMFIPGSAVVHQGSYAWILVLLAVPFAWAADRWPPVAWLALAATAIYSTVAYGPPAPDVSGDLAPLGLGWMVLGASIVAVAAWCGLRWASPEGEPQRGRHLAPHEPRGARHRSESPPAVRR